MSYLIYGKWNLFCIHKRRFLNTCLIKKMNISVANWLWWGMFFTQIFVCYFVVSNILIMSSIDALIINDFEIGKIFSNEHLIKFIIMGYVLFVSILISVNAGVYVLTDKEELLSINYNLDCSILKIVKIINYVLYASKELMTVIFPIVISFFKYWEKLDALHVIMTILLMLVIVEIRIILTVLFCIYKVYIKSQNRNQVMIITAIRSFMFALIAIYIGAIFSEWMDKFPIVKKTVDGKVVEAWFDEGASIVVQLYKQGISILDIGNQAFVKCIIIFLCLVQVILLLSIKIFCSIKTKDIEVRGVENSYLKQMCRNDLYCKAVLFNTNRIYNVSYLFKSVNFWIITGFFTGIMMDVLQIKMIHFLCTACAFYYSCYLANANFHKNIHIYALDGEGKESAIG